MSRCIYCGEFADCRDHIITYSYNRVGKRTTGAAHISKAKTVPACNNCNITLSAVLIFNLERRAKFILEKIGYKLRKLINNPDWSEDELLELDEDFKKVIVNKLNEKECAIRRYAHLSEVARGKRFAD